MWEGGGGGGGELNALSAFICHMQRLLNINIFKGGGGGGHSEEKICHMCTCQKGRSKSVFWESSGVHFKFRIISRSNNFI